MWIIAVGYYHSLKVIHHGYVDRFSFGTKREVELQMEYESHHDPGATFEHEARFAFGRQVDFHEPSLSPARWDEVNKGRKHN